MATGRIGRTPVLSLPGLPDRDRRPAAAGRAADRLPAGLEARRLLSGRLTRKIASAIGFREIVLLARDGGFFAAGSRRFLAGRPPRPMLLAVPADSEGYPAGATVNARLLRDTP